MAGIARVDCLCLLHRNCYKKDEGDLEFHKIYTFASCQLECKIKEGEYLTLNFVFFTFNLFKSAMKDVGCIPWYLPQTPNGSNIICNPWETENFILEVQVSCLHFNFNIHVMYFF